MYEFVEQFFPEKQTRICQYCFQKLILSRENAYKQVTCTTIHALSCRKSIKLHRTRCQGISGPYYEKDDLKALRAALELLSCKMSVLTGLAPSIALLIETMHVVTLLLITMISVVSTSNLMIYNYKRGADGINASRKK